MEKFLWMFKEPDNSQKILEQKSMENGTILIHFIKL